MKWLLDMIFRENWKDLDLFSPKGGGQGAVTMSSHIKVAVGSMTKCQSSLQFTLEEGYRTWLKVSLDVGGNPVDFLGFTIKSRQDAFEAFAKPFLGYEMALFSKSACKP